MKKAISVLLYSVMILSLAACKDNLSAAADPTEAPATNEPVITAMPTDEPTEAPTEFPSEAPTEMPTPDPLAGYNEHDMQRILAFLETVDKDGVTNGKKCFDDYDPEAPSTWHAEYANIVWSDGPDKRLIEIGIGFRAVVGTLDVSDCTELKHLTCWAGECNI